MGVFVAHEAQAGVAQELRVDHGVRDTASISVLSFDRKPA
jgi:hypothetical protein